MKWKQFPAGGAVPVMFGLVVLATVELLALDGAPEKDRPVFGAALTAAATSALVVAVLLHRRRAARRIRQDLAEAAHQARLRAEDLDGFPMEEVRPLLLGKDAPELDTLCVAWVLAGQGRSTVWIERHLHLTAPVARSLVDAARRRS